MCLDARACFVFLSNLVMNVLNGNNDTCVFLSSDLFIAKISLWTSSLLADRRLSVFLLHIVRCSFLIR